MYQPYIKRTFDTSVSFIVLIFALPVGIILAVFIKIDSKGPSIFKQKRTGLNGTEFKMYKFRTMAIDNDIKDADNANLLTTVGKIIRALSLDEIPQLINIIKGDMSLIGPRPWVPEYYQNMTTHQRKRVSVRPGITGLAQARGRNNLNVFEKINYDLQYVDNVTLVNDVKIIILTVLALFEKTGAAIEKSAIHQEIQSLMSHAQNTAKPALNQQPAFYSKLENVSATDRISRRKNTEDTKPSTRVKSTEKPTPDEQYENMSLAL